MCLLVLSSFRMLMDSPQCHRLKCRRRDEYGYNFYFSRKFLALTSLLLNCAVVYHNVYCHLNL